MATIQKKVLNEKTYSNRKEITTQYNKATNGETLSLQEVEILVREIQAANASKVNFQMMVRGLAPDKWSTLKSLKEELQPAEYDDYFKNKVKDSSKFSYFFQLHITTIEQVE